MFLQGSSYNLPIQIIDAKGRIITNADVIEASFTIGNLTKNYKNDGTGEVDFDYVKNSWIIPLTQEETFNFKKGLVEWQARFLFSNGLVDGTRPKSENVFESINETIFTTEVENA